MIKQGVGSNFVVISGCSGGGKSTLLHEFSKRGHRIIEEPGRRIVIEETAGDGHALPWVNMAAFAHRAIAMALADREVVTHTTDWVFFDRSLIDAASALHYVTGDRWVETLGHDHRYHCKVFMTQPWPEIYCQDSERKHDFEAAVEEYERLLDAYEELGYQTIILPKTNVAERADFVVRHLTDSR